MKLRILHEAELEAAEAAAWYDDREFGLGDEFLSEVNQAIAEIADARHSFSRLEDYSGAHGFFMFIEFVPALGKALVQRMLAWQLWQPEGSDGYERAYVGELLTGWLYGCGAGLLAVWLRSGRQ